MESNEQESEREVEVKKNKKNMKKEEKMKKIPKILGYFFYKNGLSENNIILHEGNLVLLDDLLSTRQLNQFSEQDFQEVLSEVEEINFDLQEREGRLYVQSKLDESQQVNGFSQHAVGVSPIQQSADSVEQSTKKHPTRKQRRNRKPQGPDILEEDLSSDVNSYAYTRGRESQSAHMKATSGADIKLSKGLSYLLRHGAEKEGFTLMQGGFLYVDDVLSWGQFKRYGHSLTDVQRVVDNNEKRRFHLEQETESGRWMIRANQGHSVQVDGLDLKRIESHTDYPVVVHGTYTRNWQSIRSQGLSRCNRSHIHFASGEPGDSGVISGMRKSCDILIYINLKRAIEDGLEFFLSANNVILCPGNEQGFIHPKYFSEVYQRSPRKRIFP